MTHPFEHIIEGCRGRNEKSQEQLYRHCYPDMLKVCTLYSASMDDAVVLFNEAMLKVFKAIDQYKAEGDFMAWVRKIVVNTGIDNWRRKAKYVKHEIREINEEDEMTFTIDPEAYNTISGKEVLEFLKVLPINTSMVFNLYVMEGYSHEDIALRLGIAIGTSRWHLTEARRLLKNKIESSLTKEFYLHAI